MGNQLFLVANLLATAQRTGIPAYLEAAPFSSSAEAPRPTYWGSLFRNLSQHGVQMCVSSPPLPPLPFVAVPETRPVRKVLLDAQRACVFNMVGFFQSEAFFDDYPTISSVIPPELWSAAREHLAMYYGGGSCHTVALHVRRGDYTRFADVFEQLDVVEYYDAAVRQLLGGLLLQSPSALPQQPSVDLAPAPPAGPLPLPFLRLLVFCEEERFGRTVVGYFRTKYRGAVLVSLVCAATEASAVSARPPAVSPSAGLMPRDVLELLMMSQCNDVVMANSTFSWWGAYLNRVSLHRVIAPSRWFVKDPYPASNHLYCPGWILL
ncbi:galactoside 2-alpha-L-fucosyltransferase, putative [Leishmania panamensis]|uniref:Galactoside 2-alpha-L-fucosyltransferase, putative n=2 Tax=Leishmania guyanensis species complex TaxID=38579 RepID=A0A088S0V3_LEIPA|nr:galactoside 2-alpha-L-fucosyltransferase, putative [Leishmania panamensis]AIN95111.1 galactoside 2-alpha-L-fucosyltransferase, putative [Leishmania panamensis]